MPTPTTERKESDKEGEKMSRGARSGATGHEKGLEKGQREASERGEKAKNAGGGGMEVCDARSAKT